MLLKIGHAHAHAMIWWDSRTTRIRSDMISEIIAYACQATTLPTRDLMIYHVTSLLYPRSPTPYLRDSIYINNICLHTRTRAPSIGRSHNFIFFRLPCHKPAIGMYTLHQTATTYVRQPLTHSFTALHPSTHESVYRIAQRRCPSPMQLPERTSCDILASCAPRTVAYMVPMLSTARSCRSSRYSGGKWSLLEHSTQRVTTTRLRPPDLPWHLWASMQPPVGKRTRGGGSCMRGSCHSI